MSNFRIDGDALSNYQTSLKKERHNMVEQTTALGQRFASYNWDDNISAMTKLALNGYFRKFNLDMAVLSNAIRDIDQVLLDMEEYAKSAQ